MPCCETKPRVHTWVLLKKSKQDVGFFCCFMSPSDIKKCIFATEGDNERAMMRTLCEYVFFVNTHKL